MTKKVELVTFSDGEDSYYDVYAVRVDGKLVFARTYEDLADGSPDTLFEALGTVLGELGISVGDATENLQIDEETGEIANEELGKVL